MNYIIFQDIKEILKKSIRSLKTEVSQRFIFKLNKYKHKLSTTIKTDSGKNNNNTIHICNSTSIYREWNTYIGETKLSKDIRLQINNEYIKFLRIIFPYGIRANKEININLTLKNSKEKNQIKEKDRNKNIIIKNKDIKYLRNLNHVDIEVNKNIKEIKIENKKTPLTIQRIKKIETRCLKTIYIILDAVDYKSFVKSKSYERYLNIDESFTFKAFAPSTVTGSSFPSLITLQPVLTHMIGDYKQWFYSSKLESLPQELQTISEIIKHKCEYSEAFTSFSKSMPFYNYYRGFNIYNNRCTGNNYSPSAIDLLMMSLLENSYLYSQLNTSFLFVHDIGGHPPVFPNINLTEKTINIRKSSYNYSIEISLNKINSLINELKSSNQFDNTNLIITSDHTESTPDFSKDRYHLFPNRIEVPVYIKPTKNLNKEKIKNLTTKNNLLPSSYLISKLMNIIYGLNLDHPKYIFENICWLSSVFKYPDRKNIYTLGYDTTNQLYISVSMKTFLLDNYESNSTLKDLEIYILKETELIKISNKSEKNRIKNSYRSYLESCRRYKFAPTKLADQIFM